MLRPALILAVLATMANSAIAADLPVQSKLGAVFAEPAPRKVAKAEEEPITLFPWPYTAGYYGPQYGAYKYRSYYGTSMSTIFGRYPYNCLSYACSP